MGSFLDVAFQAFQQEVSSSRVRSIPWQLLSFLLFLKFFAFKDGLRQRRNDHEVLSLVLSATLLSHCKSWTPAVPERPGPHQGAPCLGSAMTPINIGSGPPTL